MVKGLPEDVWQVCNDAIICKENVMFGEQLAKLFVLVVISSEVVEPDDTSDAGAESSGKGEVCDGVFVGLLRIGRYQTNSFGDCSVQGVRDWTETVVSACRDQTGGCPLELHFAGL